ncbi:hypothetical protein [Solwaraspora sp. WMMD792]|uniref:hypothetical protein n=1 Tax=Solwaraspora sp. WMMD792 TaxID=3016099 RepID=UPI0024177CB5|nr:hypothetical protein [Solwaraspora sp. WMMD792]MDG4770373.1 hypothetical protein [Solwaraspora sp. WMMD792]
MDGTAIRGNVRTVVGLVGVALALAVVVSLVPHEESVPAGPWQPPASYALADTVDLGDGRTVRLWTKPGAWYVEILGDGQHEEFFGVGGGSDRFTVAEVCRTIGGCW